MLTYKQVIVLVFLISCQSADQENNLNSSLNQSSSTYLFQDTSIKRSLLGNGYEGAILEKHREDNSMFPYATSHTRLKAWLTPDSTFVVNYLFFKNGHIAPDTVIYFLDHDYPQNSYYARKEPGQNGNVVETKFNLNYNGKQIILSKKKNYEIFKFKSRDGDDTELHFWLPDIGIIKIESGIYDRSFVLSFGSDDFRTKLIKDVLRKAKL